MPPRFRVNKFRALGVGETSPAAAPKCHHLLYKLNEGGGSTVERIDPKYFKAQSNVQNSTDGRSTVFLADTWKIKIFSLLLFA